MAEQSTELDLKINIIENAVYGREVRQAIADGIRLCYNYVSGQAAIDAAIRAEGAVEELRNVVSQSSGVMRDLQAAVSTAGDLVIVSQNQPDSPDNKIWIKPQSDSEYKVATYDAYVALWDHVNQLNEVYNNGNGGVISITRDETYTDAQDALKKRYVIHYSNGEDGEIFIRDGAQGPAGPADDIIGYDVYYATTDVPPTVNGQSRIEIPIIDWDPAFPTIQDGTFLWTKMVLSFQSGEVAYLYNVTYQGKNGSGAVDGVKIGSNGELMTGVVTLPLDTTPTEGHTNVLMSSDAIKTALDTALSGDVETLDSGDSSQKIANAEFVQNELEDLRGELTAPAFTGKTFSVVGDSISACTGFIPAEIVNRGGEAIYPVAANVGDVTSSDYMWWSRLASKTGMTPVTIDAYGGSRFYNYAADEAVSWTNRLKDGTTLPDYIFVYLGVNDWGTSVPLGEWPGTGPIITDYTVPENRSFANACARTLSMIATAYKRAKIYCFTFPETYGNYQDFAPGNAFPRFNTAGYTPSQANDVIRNITASLGIGLIDLRRYSGINYFTEASNIYTIDGLHLNRAGMERVADIVAKTIM